MTSQVNPAAAKSIVHALEDRRRGLWPVQFHDTAPDMGCVLVHESSIRIAKKQFGEDKQLHADKVSPTLFFVRRMSANLNVLFAVKSFLDNMRSIAVRGQFDDMASKEVGVHQDRKEIPRMAGRLTS